MSSAFGARRFARLWRRRKISYTADAPPSRKVVKRKKAQSRLSLIPRIMRIPVSFPFSLSLARWIPYALRQRSLRALIPRENSLSPQRSVIPIRPGQATANAPKRDLPWGFPRPCPSNIDVFTPCQRAIRGTRRQRGPRALKALVKCRVVLLSHSCAWLFLVLHYRSIGLCSYLILQNQFLNELNPVLFRFLFFFSLRFSSDFFPLFSFLISGYLLL